MNMSGSGGVLSVPSEHLPGLVALLVLPIVLWASLVMLRALATREVTWAQRALSRLERLSLAARVALVGVLVGAVVHGALVPTHWSADRTVAVLFIVDTVGFAVAALWILASDRHWRPVALAMLGGTTGVYVWYVLTGRETTDLVGLVTTTVELAAALVVLVTMLAARQLPAWRSAPRLLTAATGVALLALLGTTAVAGASATAPTSATSSAAPTSGTTMPGMAGSSASTQPLSLTTSSPAGPILWPDNMTTMAPGMEMATPNCTAQPTTAQQTAAVNLVDQTVAAAAPYESLAAAKAAGYVPVTPPGQPVVHYINPAIYRQGPTLDPNEIPVLVYVNTPHGAVLSAAMYLMHQSAVGNPPQPGGCLTQWHIHTDLCFSGGRVVGNNNAGACAAGSLNRVTAPMMHIWLTPVSGGPLAPDPPAANEVDAAKQMPTSNHNGIA
jgi:hypothetical protein